ncbi:unnamed protein product [Cylindrotheca closterium]|uniref:Uncharacterized protein n=1 Tax=Cylindrotheca closterium TaxID=2856 RepID=A0AAD2FEQ4_9STRA|nr:unnamed protein product [Cylindrotheca closterium]
MFDNDEVHDGWILLVRQMGNTEKVQGYDRWHSWHHHMEGASVQVQGQDTLQLCRVHSTGDLEHQVGYWYFNCIQVLKETTVFFWSCKRNSVK